MTDATSGSPERGAPDPGAAATTSPGIPAIQAVSGTTLTVAADDDTVDGVPDLEWWRTVARDTLLGEGIVGGHLDLLFVDPDVIAELKGRHLGERDPTDVLAFPLDGPEAAQEAAGPAAGPAVPLPAVDGPPRHLGDVVLCPEVARRQAPDHAGSFEAEMALLIVHGVLHVLGHDHAEPVETRRMQDRERLHLRRLGHRHPVEVPS